LSDFSVGLRRKHAALGFQPFTQAAEIFDNAIMHQRQRLRRVRVGIGRRGRAMRGPARMGNAGGAMGRIGGQFLHQPDQLARRAAAHQFAAMHDAHARGIIAAIFHPAQTIDQTIRHIFLADDADNAAHTQNPCCSWPLPAASRAGFGACYPWQACWRLKPSPSPAFSPSFPPCGGA